MTDLECPACGEAEDLCGAPTPADDDVIRITCGACGQAWDRDPSPRCDRCGGGDMFTAIRAIVEKSRGTQLSIVATEPVPLCRTCDAGLIHRYRISRSPLMPDELPTT